jgi:hypothetical protein
LLHHGYIALARLRSRYFFFSQDSNHRLYHRFSLPHYPGSFILSFETRLSFFPVRNVSSPFNLIVSLTRSHSRTAHEEARSAAPRAERPFSLEPRVGRNGLLFRAAHFPLGSTGPHGDRRAQQVQKCSVKIGRTQNVRDQEWTRGTCSQCEL